MSDEGGRSFGGRLREGDVHFRGWVRGREAEQGQRPGTPRGRRAEGRARPRRCSSGRGTARWTGCVLDEARARPRGPARGIEETQNLRRGGGDAQHRGRLLDRTARQGVQPHPVRQLPPRRGQDPQGGAGEGLHETLRQVPQVGQRRVHAGEVQGGGAGHTRPGERLRELGRRGGGGGFRARAAMVVRLRAPPADRRADDMCVAFYHSFSITTTRVRAPSDVAGLSRFGTYARSCVARSYARMVSSTPRLRCLARWIPHPRRTRTRSTSPADAAFFALPRDFNLERHPLVHADRDALQDVQRVQAFVVNHPQLAGDACQWRVLRRVFVFHQVRHAVLAQHQPTRASSSLKPSGDERSARRQQSMARSPRFSVPYTKTR